MTTTGTRLGRFVRSLAYLAVVVVGVPWVLMAASRARFGGVAPLHGVPGPGDWRWEAIRRSLTEQLTEQTVADIVVRTCLVVAWVSVVVLVVTVVAELIHMARHDGLPLPDVRGLGVPQAAARVIASGLLVVLPSFASSGTAVALDGVIPSSARATTSSTLESTLDAVPRPHNTWIDDLGARSAGVPDASSAAVSSAEPVGGREASAPLPEVGPRSYVVRGGDSVYAIAERFAGPDAGAADIVAYADRLVETNLGRAMPDGQRFTNAAYIDVGWVLELPDAPAADDRDDGHTVAPGETLWSIAEDELGDGARWPEIHELNEGRTFADGRTFDDPDLIQPGWELDLPDVEPPVPTSVPDAAEPAPADATAADADRSPTDTDESDEAIAAAVDDEDDGHEHDRPRPVNVWNDESPTADAVTSPPIPVAAEPGRAGDAPPAWVAPRAEAPLAGADTPAPDGSAPDGSAPDGSASDGVELLTLGRAAMLSAGALTLLAVRRRRRLRSAPPRARLPELPAEVARTERRLRTVDPGDRFARVDVAVRAAASTLVAEGHRVVAVRAADDGSLLLTASGPVELDVPWESTGDRCTWAVSASTPIELLADDARRVGVPCPALVQIGRTLDGWDVYVDLEALEAIEVGGPGDQAEAVVTALAATLAGSVLAEVATLVGVGIDDAAFLGHRHHVPARDIRQAFDRAAEAVGTTAEQHRSTFELRSRGTGGETWEPAIVLAGSAAGTVTPPANRTGLAVVSASPIHGPSSRLEPDGTAWMLRPLGVRLVPVGLPATDVAALGALLDTVHGEMVVEDGPLLDLAAHRPGDGDHTLAPVPEVPDGVGGSFVGGVGSGDRTVAPVPEVPDGVGGSFVGGARSRAPSGSDEESAPVVRPPVLVRLLGPVAVEAVDGTPAAFERSKAAELVAWLVTHRDRPTRSAARTALWELDVRDATFANVVSDARRSIARLVPPPVGEEWIGRTLTEHLPLHPHARSDADLVHEALELARVQPPDQAIATLRPAVDLVAGLPFEGTGYLWPDAEGLASQLVLLCTTATSELAAHCLSVGDVEGVLGATGRGLRVLPGHEELIGLRMQAHACSGDQAGVRQEWEQYERVINADPWSDGEPSPRLVALRRDLLAR